MSQQNDRTRQTQLSRARDELFSHIHRCGVLQAAEEHQLEWMEDTVDYLRERYPALGDKDLGELKQIGLRFCQPVIRRVEEPSEDHVQDEDDTGADEAAAA